MNRSRVTSIVLAVSTAATLTSAAGPASAATRSCPARAGTLAKDSSSRIWHQGDSLYACTTGYGVAPRSKRLGPYAPGTRVALGGTNVAWTVRQTKEGRRTDRVWAADLFSGRRWMLAQKPNPGGVDKPSREVLIQRLALSGTALAWVTKGGDVVAALRDPVGPPTVIGTLPAPPVRQDKLFLIGSFADTPVAELGRSLKVTPGGGDGDECGGVEAIDFTVRPQAGGPVAGIRAEGGYASPVCD